MYAKRMSKGDRNPRHFILIQVGTGNQYCRNCEHLLELMGNNYCRVFKNDSGECLKINSSSRFGAIRCGLCLAAEKAVENIKEEARREGHDAALYKVSNALESRKSGGINA